VEATALHDEFAFEGEKVLDEGGFGHCFELAGKLEVVEEVREDCPQRMVFGEVVHIHLPLVLGRWLGPRPLLVVLLVVVHQQIQSLAVVGTQLGLLLESLSVLLELLVSHVELVLLHL
jgi:hypothetical protein